MLLILLSGHNLSQNHNRRQLDVTRMTSFCKHVSCFAVPITRLIDSMHYHASFKIFDTACRLCLDRLSRWDVATVSLFKINI